MLLTYAAIISLALRFAAAKPSPVSAYQPKGPTSHIIGGEEATPGQWPSQLTLEFLGSSGWAHICGAVLFRTSYAITAAHCVDGVSVSNLRLWAGVIYRDNPASTNGELLPIATYTMHQNYSALTPGFPNNLAIIRLTIPADVTAGNIDNAIMPPDDQNEFLHSGCFVSGYGRVDTDSAMSNSLQWRQIDVITNDECLSSFAGISNIAIYPEHMCVISDPPSDGPCNGDAGGPLHCYPTEADTSVQYVAGIVSWNAAVNQNCNLQYPTVVTRTSKYLQWIYANTP